MLRSFAIALAVLSVALALPRTASGATPLIDAVKAGNREAVVKLITQRVDVNAPEPDGTTALHWAVQRNDLDLVTRLIRAGAKVNVAIARKISG